NRPDPPAGGRDDDDLDHPSSESDSDTLIDDHSDTNDVGNLPPARGGGGGGGGGDSSLGGNPSSGSGAAPAGGSSGANGGGKGGNGGGKGGNGGGRGRSNRAAPSDASSSTTTTPPTNTTTALEKISVPKEYPQLLAIPLTRRPLFPGFYKSLYIKDPKVIAAIQALVDRRQPYVAILLSKDDDSDLDVVRSLEEVHRVGVFAQITNIYNAGPDNSALTVVVYPHRRIRVNGIVSPPSSEDIVLPFEAVDSVASSASPPLAASPQGTTSSSPETSHEGTTTSSTETSPQGTTSSSSESTTSSSHESTAAVVEEDHLTVEIGAGTSNDRQPAAAGSVEDALHNKILREKGYLPINDHLSQYPVTLVNVDNQHDQPYTSETPLVKATTSEMLNVLKEISQLNPLLRDQIITFSIQTGGNAFADPARLADFAAAVSSGEPGELQSVLESLVVEERLSKALVVLKKELANAKLQQEISKEVDRKITRKQQEYFLMEQLKGIKRELGMEGDGKDKLVEKFRERGVGLVMPGEVRKVFEE
ncbi:ATP-dependent Lon protease pim1, partial [Dinochytrium kinnereticum]